MRLSSSRYDNKQHMSYMSSALCASSLASNKATHDDGGDNQASHLFTLPLATSLLRAHISSYPLSTQKVNRRRRWYYEVTLVGASKGTRVGWARCGGAFSRGVPSDDEGEGQGGGGGRGRPDAAIPKLGHGGDSWGICGHKQGKSYHRAGRVRAGRVEAAAKARRDQRKEDGQDDEEEGGGEEAGSKDRSGGEGGSSGGTESGGEAAGEDEEEDTADSIFLALGGLFRDTSFTVDQEREDGGNVIEYFPAAAAAAAAATTAATPPTPSIPLPPPPVSSRLNPAQAPSTPPPPSPPPPSLPSAGSTAGMKLPRSPFSREADSPLRPWGAGAVIGCLADLVGSDGEGGAAGGDPGEVRLHFFLNGRPVNGNASVPIFTTTAVESEPDWSLCPAFSCSSASDGVTVNLGDTPFQFPPDGLIATLGASPTEGGGAGGAVAAAASSVASPSSVASTREKRSRYASGAAAMLDRTSPHAALGRAAERALENAFGIDIEGRASPSPASTHGGGGGGGAGAGSAGSGEVGSPHSGGSGARTMAEALRSPSKKLSSEAAENNAATSGKQGRTKGIVGGVLAVKDAAVSRCVRFDGHGWAVARRPNLTVQALDVFLLEALIRPTARSAGQEAGSGGGEAATRSPRGEEEQESVVLSQAGASGFCLAVQGTKAVLQLNGPDPAAAAGEHARHATPEGVLPAEGTWFKLSAAVARDASKGVDKVRAVWLVCSFLEVALSLAL